MLFLSLLLAGCAVPVKDFTAQTREGAWCKLLCSTHNPITENAAYNSCIDACMEVDRVAEKKD